MWNMEIYLKININKNKLSCHVIQARNVKLLDENDISEPCVKIQAIKISEECSKYNKASVLSPRTRNVKGSLNPEWNEKLQVVFNQDKCHKLALLVQCWNSNKFESTDLIGYQILLFSSIINNPQDDWFVLLPNDNLPNELSGKTQVLQNMDKTLEPISCEYRDDYGCYEHNVCKNEQDKTLLEFCVGPSRPMILSRDNSSVKHKDLYLNCKECMRISCLCKSEASTEVYCVNQIEDSYKEDMTELVPSPNGSQKQEEYSEFPSPIEEAKRKTESKEVGYSACFENGPLSNVTLGLMQPLHVVGLPLGLNELRQDLDQNFSQITINSTKDVYAKEGISKTQKFRNYLSSRHS
jgi:hypothetical protein